MVRCKLRTWRPQFLRPMGAHKGSDHKRFIMGLLIDIILVALANLCHALLYKRNTRSALVWIAVCLLYPLVDPILNFLFGINRVRTRAKRLHRNWQFPIYIAYERPENDDLMLKDFN